jgi:pyrroloquinoline quinone biosynthesis protein A
MQWVDPAFCDIRLGFEVTAYVFVRCVSGGRGAALLALRPFPGMGRRRDAGRMSACRRP